MIKIFDSFKPMYEFELVHPQDRSKMTVTVKAWTSKSARQIVSEMSPPGALWCLGATHLIGPAVKLPRPSKA
jgi:hypothetical protein